MRINEVNNELDKFINEEITTEDVLDLIERHNPEMIRATFQTKKLADEFNALIPVGTKLECKRDEQMTTIYTKVDDNVWTEERRYDYKDKEPIVWGNISTYDVVYDLTHTYIDDEESRGLSYTALRVVK